MPNTFNQYNYDTYCFISEDPDIVSARIRSAPSPAMDGTSVIPSLRESDEFTLMGALGPSIGTQNIEDLWRDLKNKHTIGTPGELRLTRFPNRFRRCVVRSITEIQTTPAYIDAKRFEIRFFMFDPFHYKEPKKGPFPLSTGGPTFLVNEGGVYTNPEITISITGVGSGTGTVTINHGGGRFILRVRETGTYKVYGRDRYVTRNGNMYYNYDGTFPRMPVGSHPIVTSLFAGVTAGTAYAEYYERD